MIQILATFITDETLLFPARAPGAAVQGRKKEKRKETNKNKKINKKRVNTSLYIYKTTQFFVNLCLFFRFSEQYLKIDICYYKQLLYLFFLLLDTKNTYVSYSSVREPVNPFQNIFLSLRRFPKIPNGFYIYLKQNL